MMHVAPSAGDYHDRINADLLALIPPDAKRVLEIGCGSGALGQAWLRQHPAVDYIGMERAPHAAAIARQRISRVLQGDAEAWVPAADGVADVDCLIYGDVLEHFVDPWAALSRHLTALKPGGLLLACVPNVQHWSLSMGLLQGEWTYCDEGLLDRTHLRFFTLNSVRQMVADAGLEVIDIRARAFRLEGFESLMQAITPALRLLRVNIENYRKQAAALQYVVRAARRANSKISSTHHAP